MATQIAHFYSSDARQRDLLPLPHFADFSQRTCLAHLGRGTRQRVSARHRQEERCDIACNAISSLGCGAGFKPATGVPSEAALAAQRVVQGAVEQYPLPAELPRPDEALSLLLHSGGEYDGVSATGALAPYGSGELSLPSDASSCPTLVSMLNTDDAASFVGFREHLLLPEPEYKSLIDAAGGQPGLYFDPVLKHHRHKYLALIEQMCGMLRRAWGSSALQKSRGR